MRQRHQPSLKSKRIIFKYKDSKIVKSPKDNKNLDECTTGDLKREIIRSFKIKQDRWKEKKLQKINCFSKITGCAEDDIRYRNQSFISCTSQSSECSDEVNVEVSTDDGRIYLVDIKTNEKGVHRNHTDFDKKIIFCKAVSYFYKNWRKSDET